LAVAKIDRTSSTSMPDVISFEWRRTGVSCSFSPMKILAVKEEVTQRVYLSTPHHPKSRKQKSMIFSFASAWWFLMAITIQIVKKLTGDAWERFNHSAAYDLPGKAMESAKLMAEVSREMWKDYEKILLRSRMLTNSRISSIGLIKQIYPHGSLRVWISLETESTIWKSVLLNCPPDQTEKSTRSNCANHCDGLGDFASYKRPVMTRNIGTSLMLWWKYEPSSIIWAEALSYGIMCNFCFQPVGTYVQRTSNISCLRGIVSIGASG